jgi:hypothetical protein
MPPTLLYLLQALSVMAAVKQKQTISFNIQKLFLTDSNGCKTVAAIFLFVKSMADIM